MNSDTTIETIKPIKVSLTLKQKLMQWFRLTNALTVKLYHGYGYKNKFFIQGHVLALSALPRKKYRNKLLVNLFSLIRLFIVKPVPNALVQLRLQKKIFKQVTNQDGFFKFEDSLENDSRQLRRVGVEAADNAAAHHVA